MGRRIQVNKAVAKSKHAPERSCVACGSKQAKNDLVRMVRTISGEMEVDLTGKKSGRGAYLCQRSDCWENSLTRRTLGRLENALKTKLSYKDKVILQNYAQELAAKSGL